MQLDRKTLAFIQLPATKGDLYAPSGVKGLVQNIILHNTNTSDETVVLNYHDGTSEHEVFNQVVAAGATLVWDFRGAGDVVEDGAKYTGNTDTATKVTLKVVGTEEGPSAAALATGLNSNLWMPPDTPHPADEEFTGDLSDWAVQNVTDDVAGSFGLGQVDAYSSTFTGETIRVDLNSGRPSWLLMQPPTTSKSFFIYKPLTIPTNMLMWARMKFNIAYPAITNNDDTIGINFATDAGGGIPDTPSRVTVYLNESDANDIAALSTYNPPGSSATGFVRTTDTDHQGQALEYAAIHKLGNDYHTWVGTHAGNWIHVATYTGMTFTPDMVAIQVRNNIADGAGPGVHGIDFVRFIETDEFLL